MSMRRLTRVLAAATLLLGGSLLAAAPASAQSAYPPGSTAATLSISASAVAQGDPVIVSGANYKPNEAVTATVFSTPQPLGTKIATSNGTFNYSFSTANLSLGAHRVVVTGATGDSASAAFTVVAPGQASGLPAGTSSGSSGSGSGSLGSGSGSLGTGNFGSASGSGFGSSIDTGNPGAGSGPNGGVIVGGIVLVAVALGGGVFIVRRRRTI